MLVPPDVVFGFAGADLDWRRPASDQSIAAADLPALPDNAAIIQAHLNQPYTVSSLNGDVRYRLLITERPNRGQVGYLVVGAISPMWTMRSAGWSLIELLVGLAVLIVMGLASFWVVRVSLRPLAAIERTAGRHRRGDLTQRVPELDRRTEVGRSRPRSTRCSPRSSRRSGPAGVRAAGRAFGGADAPVRRRRQPRAAYPADHIRGFAELYRQGAVRAGADTDRDAPHRGRGGPDGPARRGPAAARPAGPAAPVGAGPGRPCRYCWPTPRQRPTRSPAGRTIAVELAEPADRSVVAGDEARLRQVIGNLMTNALTHTPAGTAVALRLRTEDRTRW